MPKIIEYRYVSAHYDDTTTLAEEVDALIKQGWQPFGGIASTGEGSNMQAMVKYETIEGNNHIQFGDIKVFEDKDIPNDGAYLVNEKGRVLQTFKLKS